MLYSILITMVVIPFVLQFDGKAKLYSILITMVVIPVYTIWFVLKYHNI